MARAIPLPTAWEKPVKTWLASLHARGLSPTTIALYRAHVSQMARGIDCPPEQVTGTILENWCASREWAVETRRSAYLAYTQFFTNYAERTGRKNPAAILVPPGPPPREPRPAPEEAITEGLAEASPRVKRMIRLGPCSGYGSEKLCVFTGTILKKKWAARSCACSGKATKKGQCPSPQTSPTNCVPGPTKGTAGCSPPNAVIICSRIPGRSSFPPRYQGNGPRTR